MESLILDFTTPATIRPDILDQTYSSFHKNLQGVDFKQSRLLINIDPLPQGEISRIPEMIKVAQKYFGTVEANRPKIANFSRAINWLWTKANRDFIFHLEDDWELMRPVDLGEAMQLMRDKPFLQQVRLRWKKSNKFVYGYAPCLIRRKMYEAVAGKLSKLADPEKQLQDYRKMGIFPAVVGTTVIGWPDKIVIRDIGREWRDSRRIKKDNKRGCWTEGVP